MAIRGWGHFKRANPPQVGPVQRLIPSADRAELETAAAALLGYHLAGRRTQDELLGEVLAAWAEFEGLTHQRAQRVLEEGPRRGGRAEPEVDRGVEATSDRHLVAWRRWLDQPAPHAPSGLGEP